MFSKKMMLIVITFFLIAVNIILLTLTTSRGYSSYGPGQVILSVIAPFQEAFTHTIHFTRDVWNNYFFLVSVSKKNNDLKKQLEFALEKNDQYIEINLSNSRLRNLLSFKESEKQYLVAAEVIGRDPSPWFKTIIIDKGKSDGIVRGLPIVVPEGIVGQIIDVSYHYSKVLLIVDQNSSADALVQRSRARGIIKGTNTGEIIFQYVLRKDDVIIGDTVISSGLDGVFPKGSKIGSVSDIVKKSSGIFQHVAIVPFVDFEKLEEVLVVLNPPENKLARE